MRTRFTALLAAASCAALVAGAAAQVNTSIFFSSGRHKLHPLNPLRPVPGAGPQFGDPLYGLNAAQTASFEEGREEFESIELASDGLGPTFNNSACAACHSAPVSGGASAITETRFGRLVNGKFDPLVAQGGSLLQEAAIDPLVLEKIPAEANVVAKRLTTPLFGAGLVEAIPDAEILLQAAIPRGDGISGRTAVVVDVVSGKQRVGRFGWKAQHATLLAFASDAYVNEMGITSRFFPAENAPNGNTALLAQYDTLADPEDVADPATGTSDIDASTTFMRLLAPPPPVRMSTDALLGARTFEQINCAACHKPVYYTGLNKVAALSVQPVRLYSDLLLHDMGKLGDGIEQGAAKMGEMKTAPLWGLRARGPFLHDGRAATVADAIRAHNGEAAKSRDRFIALPSAEQKRLLDFLNSI